MSINTSNKTLHNFSHIDNHSDNKIFGFWIYLMSDCIIFAVLFSSYFILYNEDVVLLINRKFFNINFVFIETIILLCSSIIYGYTIKVNKNKYFLFYLMILTFLLGLIFIIMEFYEFNHLLNSGVNPRNSAFTSAFFTIVGIHGLHVIAGLIWMLALVNKIFLEKNIKKNKDNIVCLGMYWHFLDIVWIVVFSFVYLMDAI